MAKDGTMSQETTIWAGQKIGENMSTKDDQGKLEVSVRILGNELVALKMTVDDFKICLLYTSPSPRDRTRSRMPSSA